MKKMLVALPICLAFAAGAAWADRVHDWEDLHKVHVKIQEAIHDMERAQAANHYDMGGHAARAEHMLRDAEHELNEAVEAAHRAP
jgi:hypothetical protein